LGPQPVGHLIDRLAVHFNNSELLGGELRVLQLFKLGIASGRPKLSLGIGIDPSWADLLPVLKKSPYSFSRFRAGLVFKGSHPCAARPTTFENSDGASGFCPLDGVPGIDAVGSVPPGVGPGVGPPPSRRRSSSSPSPGVRSPMGDGSPVGDVGMGLPGRSACSQKGDVNTPNLGPVRAISAPWCSPGLTPPIGEIHLLGCWSARALSTATARRCNSGRPLLPVVRRELFDVGGDVDGGLDRPVLASALFRVADHQAPACAPLGAPFVPCHRIPICQCYDREIRPQAVQSGSRPRPRRWPGLLRPMVLRDRWAERHA